MERIHRGINGGEGIYEEATIFFLDWHRAGPQPHARARRQETGE
jgi:hypothetical protein